MQLRGRCTSAVLVTCLLDICTGGTPVYGRQLDISSSQDLSSKGFWESRVLSAGSMAGSHRQLQTAASSTSEGVTDTRSIVPDTTQFPFNGVGIVLISLKGQGSSECSGALVHPNYVLTAAHCIHDPKTGANLQSANFAPGYNPNAQNRLPYGQAAVTRTWVPQDFVDCGVGGYSKCHQAHDFGLMQVDRNFGNYFGYSWDASDTGNTVVNTAGYPGDKCVSGSTTFGGCAMYHSSCTDSNIPRGAATDNFPCSTFHGQSGSPVWLYNISSGQRSVRGVLTANTGTNADADAGPGAFTLMSKDVFNAITSWMQSS